LCGSPSLLQLYGRAADPDSSLVKPDRPDGEPLSLWTASCNSSEKKIFELLRVDKPVHIDDIVERSSLNSSEVLATLFGLEMKGIVRQPPGKPFSTTWL
jgi:predicted Rossmann fold nucleotide-binding protein DprA/Smf involved in DNA uptake